MPNLQDLRLGQFLILRCHHRLRAQQSIRANTASSREHLPRRILRGLTDILTNASILKRDCKSDGPHRGSRHGLEGLIQADLIQIRLSPSLQFSIGNRSPLRT